MAAIGYVLSNEQFPPTHLVKFGMDAEQAGFDMVWKSDHFHPWMDNQGHSTHAWLTLAALGQRTDRILMGTGVTCPTYRYHPAMVAQGFATLAVLYPGRIFLGVGTGEAVNEEAATGEWGDYDERAERLVEAIQIIRRLWRDEWVDHSGQYYEVHGKLYDPPPQPIPIYVAAGGEESMELAGRYGDGLVTGGRMLPNRKAMDAFRKGARDEGKDPDSMSIHVEHWVILGGQDEAQHGARKWRFGPKAWDEYVEIADPREILRRAEQEVPLDDVMKHWTIGEDAQAHIEGLQKLMDAGATHIYVHSPQEDQHRVIDFYARQVLPNVQHEPMPLRA